MTKQEKLSWARQMRDNQIDVVWEAYRKNAARILAEEETLNRRHSDTILFDGVPFIGGYDDV